ncbi:MAG: hypothetical protein GTO55_05420, partial [Armatimonadetes bacterium]|nr:hypothetical protein [Armatimonadota bacterium]NIM23697.1 hypothetical protein [Armatimonadota bacterium]NIM67574.1 hypothetical protein [Armatimonadota bacterium]NIN05780.1 hypothetical protein [Armatimonadota bacterium]NIO97100.1 hypothetical protein [Armatimonadota bacterium]
MKRRRSTKLLFWLIVIIVIVGILYFRAPILRQVGAVMIVQHGLERADAIFVLGGDAAERGAHAATLYREGLSDTLVTSGGREDKELKLFDIHATEAEVTAQALKRGGVPDEAIVVLNVGKSTIEEGFAVLDYVLRHGWSSIIVVTSAYHTRRAEWVMNKALKELDVKVMLSPSGLEDYHLAEWWRYEKDLVYVNNEYLKLLY